MEEKEPNKNKKKKEANTFCVWWEIHSKSLRRTILLTICTMAGQPRGVGLEQLAEQLLVFPVQLGSSCHQPDGSGDSIRFILNAIQIIIKYIRNFFKNEPFMFLISDLAPIK